MGFIKLNQDQNLFYERIEGDPAKPCLVFLHEGLGCTAMWKQFPRQLCQETGCPGLIYDRLGYGKSSPLDTRRTVNYLHHYALYELPFVLKALIPDTPYILIGHSDGGSISLIYGAEQPSLLRGIITEAAHVFVDEETIEGIKTADQAYDLGKLEGLKKYHGEKTHQIFKAWSETWLSHWFLHWNIEYLLPSVECPLLVSQGKQDHYGTEQQVQSIVELSSGEAEAFLVNACGHTPHHEQPQIMLVRMIEFVGKIP